jgi:hypothetical protein
MASWLRDSACAGGTGVNPGVAPSVSIVSFISFISIVHLAGVAAAQGRNEHAIDAGAEALAVVRPWMSHTAGREKPQIKI